MQTLSSTAWIVHDVGLATAIGGTLFGRKALQPALKQISSPLERDLVADTAWRRFSWINLLAHGAIAATWFAGRSMLSGREVSRTARSLAVTKDVLVVASLATGIGSVILGRVLGRRNREQLGPARVRAGEVAERGEETRTRIVGRTVGALGIMNLLSNLGIAAVSNMLAIEASEVIGQRRQFAAGLRRALC